MMIERYSILGLLFLSLNAIAQGSINSSITKESAPSEVKPIIQESTELLLRTDSFISPDYKATQDKTYGFVGVHYKNLEKAAGVTDNSPHLFSDITAVVAPQDTVLSYMNISQIYTDVMGLTIGRKKILWSQLDERWHLGMFQPQFKWNPLTPESQGLTGFFLDLNNDNYTNLAGIRLFGSFLYLPDQGASFSVKGGQFQSVNPWFPQMPTQVQYDTNGQVINNIYWNIHQPDTQKILFNSSYSAQIYYGDANYKGFSAQASIAYKPSNQLALAANTATMSTPTTNVDIEPMLYFHTVSSTDLRYNFGALYIGAEALSEKPMQLENAPANMSYRIYTDKQLTSLVLGYKSSSFETSVSSLQIQGDQETVVGAQSAYLKNFLPQRLSYGNSYKASIGTALLKVKADLSYQAGQQGEYEMWSATVKGAIKKNWTWNSQVLLVRANETNVALSGAPTLFQQFQNNDMLSLGVNYVY